MVQKSTFGYIDRKVVNLYTIKNFSGTKIELIEYGAILRNVYTVDIYGKFEDIVLGYETLEDYVKDSFYFGAIVGRYANRIAKGKFTIGDKIYNLACNDGENHLHGGIKGFNKVIWDSHINNEKENSVIFKYLSKDGEEGYPGNVNLEVTYSLSEDDELIVEYFGSTDKTTVLNPSHHSYFNLTGKLTESILHHTLIINADNFTPVNSNLLPTGEIKEVNGSALDFRTEKSIGEHINNSEEQLILAGGYDHNFILNDYSQDKLIYAARVKEKNSGRILDVYTDQPGVQFYSGNFLNDKIIGKDGISYNHRTGFCLETQHYPDSPNNITFPPIVLQPGEKYKQKTIYRFSISSK